MNRIKQLFSFIHKRIVGDNYEIHEKLANTIKGLQSQRESMQILRDSIKKSYGINDPGKLNHNANNT